MTESTLECAILAGGCFWVMQAIHFASHDSAQVEWRHGL